jgi:hypothetical protein
MRGDWNGNQRENLVEERYKLRPATIEDHVYFYNEPPQYTVRAYVLEEGEKRIGIGGLVLVKGKFTLFLFKKEPISNLAAWRAIKQGLKLLKNSRLPVMAIRDKNIESSERLLKKLGFTFLQETEEEEVYIWQ